MLLNGRYRSRRRNFCLEATALQQVASIAAMGLLPLSVPKGRTRSRYSDWNCRMG
jgi:hypothetical protein